MCQAQSVNSFAFTILLLIEIFIHPSMENMQWRPTTWSMPKEGSWTWMTCWVIWWKTETRWGWRRSILSRHTFGQCKVLFLFFFFLISQFSALCTTINTSVRDYDQLSCVTNGKYEAQWDFIFLIVAKKELLNIPKIQNVGQLVIQQGQYS